MATTYELHADTWSHICQYLPLKYGISKALNDMIWQSLQVNHQDILHITRSNNYDALHKLAAMKKLHKDNCTADIIKIAAVSGYINIAALLLDISSCPDVLMWYPKVETSWHPYLDLMRKYASSWFTVEALLYAIQLNCLDIVKILIDIPNLNISLNVVEIAVGHNRSNIVKHLLDDDRIPVHWRLLHIALMHKHIETIKVLITHPRIDPSMPANIAIMWCGDVGNVEITQLLLADQRVNPTVQDNHALLAARINGHTEVEKLLYTAIYGNLS